MTDDPFVHLHVASGYSLRHGASSPAALVARAADLGQDALALTVMFPTRLPIRTSDINTKEGALL